jgi:tetratricopeptide (TPR) repeat protein
VRYVKDTVKRPDIPDYRKKQALLYIQKSAAADLTVYGNLFLAAGRMADALEFFEAAADREGLEKLRTWAEREGDFMIYLNCGKALREEPTPDGWARIGRAALAKGKLRFAREAAVRSGDPALLEDVEQSLREPAGVKP